MSCHELSCMVMGCHIVGLVPTRCRRTKVKYLISNIDAFVKSQVSHRALTKITY